MAPRQLTHAHNIVLLLWVDLVGRKCFENASGVALKTTAASDCTMPLRMCTSQP